MSNTIIILLCLSYYIPYLTDYYTQIYCATFILIVIKIKWRLSEKFVWGITFISLLVTLWHVHDSFTCVAEKHNWLLERYSVAVIKDKSHHQATPWNLTYKIALISSPMFVIYSYKQDTCIRSYWIKELLNKFFHANVFINISRV